MNPKQMNQSGCRQQACSLLPSVDPRFYAALERAALREQWARKDWERHFAQRMSYDEYRYIGFLTAEVAMGRIGEDRARDDLKRYRKANDEMTTPRLTPKSHEESTREIEAKDTQH